MKRNILFGLIIILLCNFVFAESSRKYALKYIKLSSRNGLGIQRLVTLKGEKMELRKTVPLFSVEIDDSLINSYSLKSKGKRGNYSFEMNCGIKGTVSIKESVFPGWKALVKFENSSEDTLKFANVVPFGQSDKHIYLTGTGPWSLARTKIFRPGLGPVGVILPDNAWDMGYGDVPLKLDVSLCAIARRTGVEGAKEHRYSTYLYPGTSVEYTIYADCYTGEWQNGLRLMFQDRYLYDVAEFDNTLFERPDLKWVRHKYLVTLQFAWDHNYYDKKDGKYHFEEFLKEGERLLGGYDIFGIWPTWPRLGVDSRNQWDMYEDLPGGYNTLRKFAEIAHKHNSHFFVEYNPWDKSTRHEDPYEGLAHLLKKTDADGVVLDCHGSSSEKLQKAADSVKPGIIMYSEGMAVPKDMQGIVSGRVHDAIHMPPPLNLNKLIKPDFAIFRVCQLSDGHLHREIGISFFNGIGIEINTYRPGRPDWMEEAYKYLGKTTKILRENTSTFLSQNWVPLLTTLKDSIWVNKFPNGNKAIYTVFSLIPEGYKGTLFEIESLENTHFVDIWHHEEIRPDTISSKFYLPITVNAFNKSYLNTRKEGNIDCIARFEKILNVKLEGDSLRINVDMGDKIVIWAGIPAYDGKSYELPVKSQTVALRDLFGRYEGKFVIQLFEKGELLDERVVTISPGSARLISKIKRTKKVSSAPKEMLKIPGAKVKTKLSSNDSFIYYPDYSWSDKVEIDKFYIDKYPVTNLQYKKFIDASGYVPKEEYNYLNHWENKQIPEGMENYPVVWISLEDAKAYTKWAGKRLPTEYEWQLAAQGTDGRLWPWGNKFDSTECNIGLNHITAVDAYPEGASPYGVMDMVGNVWQLTNDVYDDGSYYFVMMRGGSFYNPTSSWWYVRGGPQSLDKHQMLLMVSPGFDRCATVGFRCVKDAK